MELIYKNNYGATYKIENAPNPRCTLQLIVDSVGIFLSEQDLSNLLQLTRDSGQPCYCEACQGKKCDKIWCKSPLHDLCLKVDATIRPQMEDLILGTRFMLQIDDTLEQYRIG